MEYEGPKRGCPITKVILRKKEYNAYIDGGCSSSIMALRVAKSLGYLNDIKKTEIL